MVNYKEVGGGGGGKRSFTPMKKGWGGGGGKVSAMLKGGGHNRFELVLTWELLVLAILGEKAKRGRAQQIVSCLEGGWGENS